MGPLEPLAARLRAAAEAGLSPALAPGLRAEGPGWYAASELAAPTYHRLSELVEEIRREQEAPLHVAAALWWKGFAYWTTFPVVMGWAINRHVPLMTAENTVLHSSPGEPRLRVGLGEPLAATGGAAELGAIIRETLLEDLHAPIVEALHALTRTGRRGLWGSTAEAFAHPLVSYARDLLDDPADAAATLLRSTGGPVTGLLETPSMRRRTCCLWVTLPGRDACSTCCAVRRG
ncbi:ferric iron reductase protein FhuF [Streptosporangium becharense]|uniref:Ferric iron reductase protein FhuF n=1 Tax=Streptosporangium becharense TaxID=1816182 RepID=A0A7W9IGM8_9ACTN|nr:hypothetical protein [Streptosporangium becharense]MBB2912761.1 ferric iron reductase protein FhuF [Streptosporangium becharense]MBB5820410.1 ferric iron reductase protein FhuF [Streptosporangium becharense]